ncbi:MAG: UDP-N-acetylmuramoyl-L-alanyl-D-glutamate--2,6-diaminopimelate ligase [Coprobacillaceae bacterium]
MLKIKTNSKAVSQGDTFIAIIGEQYDGHNFIEEAITNGAIKIVASKNIVCDIELIIVKDTTQYLQEYLKENYSKELEELTIIGITGTNGKTTTTYLIYQLLNDLEIPTACIGTLGYITPKEMIPLNNTTPDILTMYELLLKAKKSGIRTVVMVVSSHALKQQRLFGITLDYGGFTNLTMDHLDYHKTMEEYLETKVLITKLLKESGKMLLNMDDYHYKSFTKVPYIGFGKYGKDYEMLNYMYTYPHSFLTFFKDEEYQIELPFIGEFNMYNYLMAVAIVHDMGVTMKHIFEVSSTLQIPDGRCTVFSLSKGKAVIDYAHTPDAVLNIIQAMRKEAKGRIITIVGCGGNRDISKRPIMGEIVTKHSDFVVFTNDNPRKEEPITIVEQMIAGAIRHNYVVILERSEAIANVIHILKENDIVLILGKGHETY